MRKQYEKPIDLENEKKVVAILRKSFPAVEFKKLAGANVHKYRADYVFIVNGLVSGLLEIKRRHIKHDKYRTLNIGLEKWMLGNRYYQEGLVFNIAILWDDILGLYTYDPDDHFEIRWGGNSKSRDPGDYEPMIHIPIERFTLYNR